MRRTIQLLYDNGISVAGLQEFQPPQAREFRCLVGSGWGMHPGAGADNVNAIVWRTDTRELVTARTYAFPYFNGHTMRACFPAPAPRLGAGGVVHQPPQPRSHGGSHARRIGAR